MKSLRERVYRMLRWSEKYTKTDMVYLAHGSFWLNGAQITTAFVSFLLAIAFGNLLSQESYGFYKYILSLSGIFGVLALSGLGTAAARAVARGYEGEFLKAVRFNLRWETLILVAGVAGSAYYYFHDNHTLALGLLIIGVFSPAKDSAELYPIYLSGKKNFRATSLLALLKTVVAAIGLFVTMLLTKNPVILVLSYFFFYTLTNILIMRWVIVKYKPNNMTDEETLGLAKHTSLINNISSFADQIDNILVFHYLGPIQLAVYNFAQAIPEYLAGFSKNIGSLAMPKFAQGEKDVVRNAIRHKTFQLFLFGATMSAAYVVLAMPFFSIFFPKYIESVRYSQIYSLILLFPGALPMAFMDSQVAIREKYIMGFIAAIIKIVLLTVGIIYYGILGAILARILTKAISLFINFYFVDRI